MNLFMNTLVFLIITIAINKYDGKIYKHNRYKNSPKKTKLQNLENIKSKTFVSEKTSNQYSIYTTKNFFEQFSISSRKIPNIIVKIIIVFVILCISEISLIMIEALIYYLECHNLKLWFGLISDYETRYVILIYLFIYPNSYEAYRLTGNSATIGNYSIRTRVRLERMHEYSRKVRESMTSLKSTYEYQSLEIIDDGKHFSTTFIYALSRVFLFNLTISI